ncbi:metal-dependent hydrolase [Wenzhouxiangella marina]|uniref:Hydrolase n=1 Tax=Wenzhouxiangella marina TaxID=1579979 RepID=A0A0K0XYU1_9GAMM|nr:metal-dependent hydrolase [Wenzhouxiangella marina]AKS42853.1 Hydrolase [Wenzhouxiangella marina]MBB6087465.1 inner membrane protein [Wenzhouxiangella marina]
MTQGVVGSLWALPAARRERLRLAAAVGWIGGMAPDLDVLIRSSTDTLLSIEYHRHFTHSLFFIPIGGLIVALVLWPLLRKRVDFGLLYLWATLGYASHGLLDACTSYGTYLLWPLAETRFAWNWISVIDPLFSGPLAVLLALFLWRRRRWALIAAWVWGLAYLGLGGLQNHRAEERLQVWADQQGLRVERLVAKPAFANLVLWRGLVDDGERYHLAALRMLPGEGERIWEGGSVRRFERPRLDADSRLERDLDRFEHFSSRWLFRYPDYDRDGRWFVGDFRYAIDPASQRPLWGIELDPDDPESRARYTTPRRVTESERTAFFQRLLGEESSQPRLERD